MSDGPSQRRPRQICSTLGTKRCCRFEENCRFSHAAGDAQLRPKRREKACFKWKDDLYTKGESWYAHGPTIPNGEVERRQKVEQRRQKSVEDALLAAAHVVIQQRVACWVAEQERRAAAQVSHTAVGLAVNPESRLKSRRGDKYSHGHMVPDGDGQRRRRMELKCAEDGRLSATRAVREAERKRRADETDEIRVIPGAPLAARLAAARDRRAAVDERRRARKEQEELDERRRALKEQEEASLAASRAALLFEEEAAARHASFAAKQERRAAAGERRRVLKEQEEARIATAQAAREAELEAARRTRLKEAAQVTVQHVLSGSIVTFASGLDIHDTITSFESCCIRIKGFPSNVKLHEVSELFAQQGISPSQFQITAFRDHRDSHTKEVDVVIATEAGTAMSVGLENIEFRQNVLSFEFESYNGPGGMGAAFVRGGVKTREDTFGPNTVTVTTASCIITIRRDDEVRHILDRLTCESLDVLDPKATAGQCPVCYDNAFTPVELGCGHTYCHSCLRHLITSASETRVFPMLCVGNEATCGTPIAIPTIQQFLTRAAFFNLLEIVLTDYVEKHPNIFRYCRTPDCTQIYRCSSGPQGQAVHCPACFSGVCSACHEDAHEGMTCAERKVTNSPAEQERLNEVWVTQQRGRVKKCPQCGVFIEKTEGCNHMTCRCGTHVCWKCMKVFQADGIYEHLHGAHGGLYGGEDDNAGDPDEEIDYQEQARLLEQFAHPAPQ